MRIRTVKPEFWQNEDLAKLGDFPRLLALALLNYSDDEGWFHANPELMRGQLFPFDETSARIQRALAQLSNCQFVALYNGKDGRTYGVVVNFTKHQKIDRSTKSKIAPLVNFDEPSLNPQRALALGTGNRDHGTGSVERAERVDSHGLPNQEEQTSAAREANAREIRRTMPGPLVTGGFVVSWERWVIHWSMTFNQGKPIPFATADNHLLIFHKMGAERAIAAIENSISRRLREPAEAFNNANHRKPNGRSFEQADSYAGLTDK